MHLLNRLRTACTYAYPILLTMIFSATPPPADAALNDCGQPISAGSSPTASDALFVLNAAVGLQECEACVCDTNGSGSTTAGDALLTLSVAVGASSDLACTSCPAEFDLDCDVESYPCSLADADEDALDKVITLLPQVWDARNAGTMDDAKTFLAGHPDVTSVVGNNHLIRFTVDGMTPVFFRDSTAVRPMPSAVGTQHPTVALPKVPREVVGEDDTGDGKVDQRDQKRALVLAPYEFQFAPNDESAQIAERFGNLEAYAGNVVSRRNTTRSDQNVILEDFFSFGSYDAVFLSTHGSRVCDILPDLSNRCAVVISTHILWDTQDRPQFSTVGVTAESFFDPDDNQSRTQVYISLTMDFWRNFYGGSLDNQLVSLSACETGNFEGSELARAMGGDDFVMMAWSEVTNTDEAFATSEIFTEELFKGVTTQKARDRVEELGFIPYINSDGIQTNFQHFAPEGDPVRIIELPRLVVDGATMPDGVNLKELVTGTIGDNVPDTLQLTLQVDGVTEDDRSDFEVRYRIDDQDVATTYDLASASLVPGFEYRYEVVHDVALGFPLLGGDLSVEVIVDLPEGGDSRFSVDAFLLDCSFDGQLSGDVGANLAGPAGFEYREDGSLEISLRSLGSLRGRSGSVYFIGSATAPGNPMTPGTYAIAGGGVSNADPGTVGWQGMYMPGVNGFDCPSCGGTITVDTVNETSMTGVLDLTTPVLFTDGIEMVRIVASFVAAEGNDTSPLSPYLQCKIGYELD